MEMKLFNRWLALVALTAAMVMLAGGTVTASPATVRTFADPAMTDPGGDFPSEQVSACTDSGSARGEMASTGGPVGGASGSLLRVCWLQSQSPESRSGGRPGVTVEAGLSRTSFRPACLPRSSVCLISTMLGRRLTLVGAKPSGTG
ncbi:MAG TPA: hypothetical protein VMY05_06665 [Acidobacteriota bacterium]|nr:hypothetical protein [Acidobacteriota bacterium]